MADTEAGPAEKEEPFLYWKRRQDLLYYQVVRILGEELAKGAQSILDVGSSGCPYLDWFPDIPVRTSLDLRVPYVADGVQSITADFLAWQRDRQYDVVLCLQVLEHVPDAAAFAKQLLASGKIVIVSVPYRWPGSKHHVHDPVTRKKLFGWFGRKPNYDYVVREPSSGVERIIGIYEQSDRPWTSLRHRAGRPAWKHAPRARKNRKAASPAARLAHLGATAWHRLIGRR